MVLTASFALACAAAVVPSAQEIASPITYRSGPLPPLAAQAVGGGEVFLEVSVNAEGHVAAVTPLRTTPPFTGLVVDAVRAWTFVPGAEGHVLVAAVFRPPAIQGPTLGELPRDVAAGSNRIPFPVSAVLPPFPPMAIATGVVLVEARVDAAGKVTDTIVTRSAPPFDDAARTAVHLWSFRPASAAGRPIASVVYVVLGFPLPVTASR